MRGTRAAHKDVLMIERFDRRYTKDGWTRQAMVSALTMLGLDEMMARYASYEDLAELIRHRFTARKDTLKELYGRIYFNVLCGNTDDHPRNHAAFWDGKMMTLTPAYDICPQNRTGAEATQAMLIKGHGRASTLATCLAAAPDYHLKEAEAAALVEQQITAIAGVETPAAFPVLKWCRLGQWHFQPSTRWATNQASGFIISARLKSLTGFLCQPLQPYRSTRAGNRRHAAHGRRQ
jgi:hypothetical protein